MSSENKNPFLTLALGLGLTFALLWMLDGSSTPTTAAPAHSTNSVITVCLEGVCDYASIQDAVDAANDGDTIKVAAGTYTNVQSRPAPPEYIGPSVVRQVVYISKTVTIQGGYTITNWTIPYPSTRLTKLDAKGQGRVIFISGAISPTIEGLYITGGEVLELGGRLASGNDAGAGVYVLTATANLRNNVIISNSAGFRPGLQMNGGAGVYLGYSSSSLANNMIVSNTSSNIGGGVDLYRSNATLTSNNIAYNKADWGGGLYLNESEAILINNTVNDNTALYGAGGGFWLDYSNDTLINNAVNGNQVLYGVGGGLQLNGSNARLIGNTITGNYTCLGGGLGGGGGIALYGKSNAQLSDNIISDNRTCDSGGGIIIFDVETNEGYASLTNNVIMNNQAGSTGGGLAIIGSSPQVTHATIARNISGEGSGIYVDAYSTYYRMGPGKNWRLSALSEDYTVMPWGMPSTARWFRKGVPGTNPSSPHAQYYSTVVLTNTILAGHSVGITVTNGNTAVLNGILWYSNTTNYGGVGIITVTNGIIGDPTFAADGYHLTAGSAARGKGVNAGVITDVDGEPRHAPPDLGADEYYPQLTVSKEATPDPVQAGTQLTYTIRVTNNYTEDLHATITDILPSHVTPGGILTWTPVAIISGSVWSQTVVVTVEMGYAGILTNAVQVTTEEGPTGIYTTTTPSLAPYLTVSKDAIPNLVQAGSQLTYIICVTNTGTVALNGIITDKLPAQVMPTGILTWPLTNLMPGDVWTTKVVGTVEMGYSGTLTNTVQATTLEGATGIYTATAQAEVTPALTMTKQANSTSVRAGELLTYTIRITNTGNTILNGTVTDTLPAHVTPTGILTWPLTGLVPGNVWAQPVVVTVTRGYRGTLTNRAQVTTQEGATGETQVIVHAIGYQVYLPIVLK